MANGSHTSGDQIKAERSVLQSAALPAPIAGVQGHLMTMARVFVFTYSVTPRPRGDSEVIGSQWRYPPNTRLYLTPRRVRCGL
jgi:hypothetical protein